MKHDAIPAVSIRIPMFVDFGMGEIAFPPIYRRQEILDIEYLKEQGFHLPNNDEINVSYQFQERDYTPQVTSQFTKWRSLDIINNFGPALDKNRWLIIRRHLNSGGAIAYAEAILDSIEMDQEVCEIETYITPDGRAYSLVTLIAPADGPENLVIYKYDTAIDGAPKTLTATFGPNSTSYDEDPSSNFLV